MNVGTLQAKLTLVTNAFEKALADSEKKMWAAGKRMTMTMSLPLMGAAGSVFGLMKAQGQWAEELSNLSMSTGLSTTRLQEFKYAADVSGISFDALASATGVLQRKLLGIEEGGGTASKVMADLGVSIKTPDGQMRSMNALFPELIAKLQAIQNPTLRNAMATQIFGRNLADVAPLLGMTAKELEGLFKQAKASGNVLTPQQLEAAKQFDDQLDIITGRLKGALAQLTGWFLSLSPTMQTVIAAITGILVVVGPIMQVIAVIKSLQLVLLPLRIAFVQTWLAATGPIAPLIAAVAAVGAAAYLIYRNWDKIKAFFGKIWDGVKQVFTAFWEWAKGLFLKYHPVGILITHWDQVKAFFRSLWDAVYDITVGRFLRTVNWIKEKVELVIGFFKNLWDKVVGHSYIPDTVDGIADQFRRLPRVMVKPAEDASEQVRKAFDLGSPLAIAFGGMPAPPTGDRETYGDQQRRAYMARYRAKQQELANRAGTSALTGGGTPEQTAEVVKLLREQLACLKQMVPQRVSS